MSNIVKARTLARAMNGEFTKTSSLQWDLASRAERALLEMADEIESLRSTLVHTRDALDWDDRKVLADIWQGEAPLPEQGLTDEVYSALIAVARWGAAQSKEIQD